MFLGLVAVKLDAFVLDWLLVRLDASFVGWLRSGPLSPRKAAVPIVTPVPQPPDGQRPHYPIPPDVANSGEHKWLFRVGISADTIFDDSCPQSCAQHWSVDDLCISPSSYLAVHANLSSATGIGASVRRRGTGHAYGRLPLASISVTAGRQGDLAAL